MEEFANNSSAPGPNPQSGINKSVTPVGQPQVYKARRAVAVVKPVYHPQNRSFDNNLQVVGTAFWLKDYKVLVTCAHVVQSLFGGPLEQTGLLVVGNMGKYSRAVISSIDLLHDLAVLLIVEQAEQFIDEEAKSGLEIIEEYPQVGEAVAYAGFPLGSQLLNSIHSPTFAEGVVGVQLRENSGGRKDVQITGAVTGGYSGAPIVLKSDPAKLVGVPSSGPTPPGSQGNIFMAVSWEHVKAIAKLAKS
jgi:hypothetical protein